MPVNPYINFGGNCREAVDFYAQAFDARRGPVLTFDGTPNGRVLHTYLAFLGGEVMFSDVREGEPCPPAGNVSITAVSGDAGQLKEIYEKLSVGATVEQEPQETFFSKFYACIVDRFGVRWQITHFADGGEDSK